MEKIHKPVSKMANGCWRKVSKGKILPVSVLTVRLPLREGLWPGF
jgi:hypothetical protein